MSTWDSRLVFALALSAAGACSSEEVVLFEFPAEDAGTAGAPPLGMTAGFGGREGLAGGAHGGSEPGSAGSSAGSENTPIACRDDHDCPEAWSCDKASCAEIEGFCIPHPLCFDLAPNPVCGCDGVTYWNDCLRKQVGPAASTPGECEASARRCWDARDCGNYGQCGYLVLPGDPCRPRSDGPHGPDDDLPDQPPPPPGRCWALPDRCDPSLDPLRWNECGEQDGFCTDTCTALRSGRPFVKSTSGTCP